MKISFEADTLQELIEQLTTFVCHATRKVEQAEGPEACAAQPPTPKPVEQVEPEAEAPKAKPAKAVKAPAVVETLNPEKPSEKDRDKARLIVIGQIRAFVLTDKSKNMKALLPLMPEGKKALDALTLEESQKIALELGIA
jgi:hypothetical protein